MKNLLLTFLMFLTLNTFSQSSTWIPVVIEDGKDMEYLAFEKNWMSINKALIDAGYRTDGLYGKEHLRKVMMAGHNTML